MNAGAGRGHCPAGHPVIAEGPAVFRYSVRFCGGVRFSLPSLIWMPMPLSSIMWISGR